MKALLDTHALIWWFTSNPQLSDEVRRVIADPSNDILVSAATAWEIATKFRIGKLAITETFAPTFPDFLQRYHFRPLAITVRHAHRAGLLEGDHKDPFDRMLAAQALSEAIPLISCDPVFDTFGVRVIW